LVVEHTAPDRVTIAGEIEIVLLQVKHDTADIGVSAPEGVRSRPARTDRPR